MRHWNVIYLLFGCLLGGSFGISTACSQEAASRFAAVVNDVKDKFSLPKAGGAAPVNNVFLLTTDQEGNSFNVLRLQNQNLELSRKSFDIAGFDRERALHQQQLSEEQRKAVDAFQQKLPASLNGQPLSEQTLVIGLATKTGWDVRHYDRTKIPEPVSDYLRHLVSVDFQDKFGSTIKILEGNLERSFTEPPNLSRFTTSTEGKQLALIRGGERILVLDSELRELGNHPFPEMKNVQGCRFSPAGSCLVIHHGSAHADGYQLSCHDTKTNTVTTTRQAENAVEPLARFSFAAENECYAWTKNQTLQVKLNPAGTFAKTELDHETWIQYDEQGKNKLITNAEDSGWLVLPDKKIPLYEKSLLLRSKFSPDGKSLAVLTYRRPEEYRLRIWKTSDGTVSSELRPYGLLWMQSSLTPGSTEMVLTWSPNSEYLLATSSHRKFRFAQMLHVWKATTGEHLADLTGGYSELIGAGFAADNKTIFAASRTDIFKWTLVSE